MKLFAGQKYENVDVELDASVFANCSFKGCRLLYRGGELPKFVGKTEMVSCNFAMRDHADRTIQFLEMLYSVGGKGVVEELFAMIAGKGAAQQ